MKATNKLFIVCILLLMVCMLCGAQKPSRKSCVKSGCNNKRVTGSSYCYIHKPSSITKKSNNTLKKNNSTNKKKGSGYSKPSKKKTTRNPYTTDMPDCDDYGSWGEFMDDWDGNMPDGSDASDYWDNW